MSVLQKVHHETEFSMAAGADFQRRFRVSDIHGLEGNATPVDSDISTLVAHSEPANSSFHWLKRRSLEMRLMKYTLFLITFATGVLFGRSLSRVATLILGLVIAISVGGCKYLTPQTTSELEQVAAAIACSIEQIEIDDPALNALCQSIKNQLTPQQIAAVEHAMAKATAEKNRRLLLAPSEGKDGGK